MARLAEDVAAGMPPAKAARRGLSAEEVDRLDGYWRATNYLSVGQIYLKGCDPCMKKPLAKTDIKSRLLGHWGTCPGINFTYTHLNRVIKRDELNMLFVCGPGHGGPGVVAHVYLEGTYSEVYPEIALGEKGMGQLLKQFSWPRGIPSHVAPFCPGSLHEGGELGYCLLHSFGAVFDNPSLIAACIVGDGEAETGPCAASWHSAKFLNAVKDGAVLPILHLNGGRIAAASMLSRMPRAQLISLFEGYGYRPHFVEGDSDNHPEMHQRMAATMDQCLLEIRAIQSAARSGTAVSSEPPVWPLIILKTPKGWTGPKQIDGKVCEGTFRAHQVPVAAPGEKDADLQQLEEWLRSYHPEELFTPEGMLQPALADAIVPPPELCMGRNPTSNGGIVLQDLDLPPLAPYECKITKRGILGECTAVLARWVRDIFERNPTNFRIFCPDEITSNKMSAVFKHAGRQGGFACPNKLLDSPFDRPDGRVVEILSEHCCQGWLEGYLLSGRHGLFPCYEAFTQVVDSMLNQHCKWLKATQELPWRRPVASLNYVLTSHTWRQDHNGYSHQSPGFIDNAVTKPPVVNVFLPPDANTLLACAKWCMNSRHKVNLMVAGKHPMPQWLDLQAAEAHFAAGASTWHWAGTESILGGSGVDVVFACCGDVPTLESIAACDWLRKRAPEVRTRLVNVVDLMCLAPPGVHEHALTEERFETLFGREETPVVFFYHGSPSTVQGLIYKRRSAARRFDVHGYIEEGSTTTPFDLTVFNKASRFHLVIEALERIAKAKNVDPNKGEHTILLRELRVKLVEHLAYIWDAGEDMPEIRDWVWSDHPTLQRQVSIE